MKIGKKLMKHNIIQITEEDILNNKFCKANENLTSVTIKRPTLKEAKEAGYRTLCLLVSSLGLSVRPFQDLLRTPTIGSRIELKKNCWAGLSMSLCNKTEKAKALLKAGKFKEALSIIKTFRLGYTKEEKRSIEIAYECLSGHGHFYQSIGIDTDKEIEKVSLLLTDKYL